MLSEALIEATNNFSDQSAATAQRYIVDDTLLASGELAAVSYGALMWSLAITHFLLLTAAYTLLSVFLAVNTICTPKVEADFFKSCEIQCTYEAQPLSVDLSPSLAYLQFHYKLLRGGSQNVFWEACLVLPCNLIVDTAFGERAIW